MPASREYGLFSCRKPLLPVLAATVAVMMAGCPLPYEFNGKGAGSAHTSDPSTPSMTAPVTVSYSAQDGSSGTVGDGSTFYSGQTMTVTLSTATVNAVIFYTDNGTPLPLTGLESAKKIGGSSGEMTITRSTSLQSLDIRAIAIGPNMLPSPTIHAKVGVSPYPILSVTRDKASVSEDGGTATFTITSSSPSAAPITVNLMAGGSYVAGNLTNTPLPAPNTSFAATLTESTTTITIPFTALPDTDILDQTVTLTILPDSNTPPAPPAYTVGAPDNAVVVIQDNQIPTYTVTYDSNGGTGTAPTDSNNYHAGDTVIVASPGSMARTGFAFAGWNTASNGTGTGHGAGTSMAMPAANVVLYAVWTPTYTVTYNGNLNSGGTVPSDGTGYLPGAIVTIKAPGTMVKNGFTFTGWNTAANGSGTAYAAGSLMTMGSANIALYAVWTTWKVTYVGNGSDGGAVPDDINGYPAGATVTVLGPSGMTRTSAFFVGWNTSAAGTGTTYAGGDTFTMGTSDMTLYAMWGILTGGMITSVPQNVTTVVIPEGVTDIWRDPQPTAIHPFSGHPNLVSVTIPSTVTAIPDESFMGCPQLTVISNNTRFQVINGALVDTQTNRLIFVPAKLSGAFIIPSGVTSIAQYAFDGCASLTSITIPASLATISGNGFSGLTSHIPIVLPDTVTTISAYAFVYSDFTSITVPASVTYIGTAAMYGCSFLTNVTMLGSNPPTLQAADVFTNSSPTIHVPNAAAQTAYLANANWLATGVSIVFP